ncbi:hypothetical protein LZA78_11025 [Sinirhodobacter sp. WL0062]|uniref:Pilus assembly protein n=1 Tax=Rhodobacter flavimaris TaxID=2907145 RepID=A0ABS8YZ37_9RHOB|nr:hypothetical protein [Sinirhodobacter sp. WL0062]MCE5974016.1 hypothetical protein [Sinirhodobacter sp. WL0062]
MKLFKLTRKFHNEEDGAVTVDWVVLTAAIVGIGAFALSLIRTETRELATNIADYIGSQTVSSQ